MSSDDVTFLIDANIFIQAQNTHYSFDICPGFWEALIDQHHQGRVFSIDHVKREVTVLKDSLADWVKELPSTFFIPTTEVEIQLAFADISTWVQGGHYLEQAKRNFADIADGWLVACAQHNGFVVVTHENHNPEQRKSVPIPNLCAQFDVEYTDPFNMLRRLGVSFKLH